MRVFFLLIVMGIVSTRSWAENPFVKFISDFEKAKTPAEVSDFPSISSAQSGFHCEAAREWDAAPHAVVLGWKEFETRQVGETQKRVIGPFFAGVNPSKLQIRSFGRPSSEGYILQNKWDLTKGGSQTVVEHYYYGGYLRKGADNRIVFWGQEIVTYSDPHVPENPKHPGSGGGGILRNVRFAGICN
jgi:hypothetical protein